ncbi:MAG: hypothetical protein GWP18_06625, partial [Proteobacteria bacterium]|nr:hypothetical protein [Pseudomonadota bacterium]
MTSVPESGGGVADEVTPYRQLDTAKRRRAGFVYLVMAGLAMYLTLAAGVDEMWLFAVAPLVGIAAYSFAGGWKIQ